MTPTTINTNKTTTTMELLIASNNTHKIEEIKTILKNKFEKIYCLKDLDIVCEPEENGTTFSENALIKATEVAKYTNLPVLADDTGLCVNALGGLPNVRSARYAGDHDHAKNRHKLLNDLRGKTDRTAYFETAVVLLYPDGQKVVANGKVFGHILEQEKGTNGFGYDSIFFCDELNKSFGDATADEKNEVSHRGRALQNLLEKL